MDDSSTSDRSFEILPLMDRKKPFYGIDSLDILALLLTICIIFFIMFCCFLAVPGPGGTVLSVLSFIVVTFFLFIVLGMLWSSLYMKFKFKKALIASMGLKGTEEILELGCGRGFFLNALAKRLNSNGKAYGFDIFSSFAQTGNSPKNTLRNSALEGVSAKVQVGEGDQRVALPFQDSSFDIVLSTWITPRLWQYSISKEEIKEMARVLRPGGRLILVKYSWIAPRYFVHMEACGFVGAQFSEVQFTIFPPVRTILAVLP
eukprot:TRINITY_DN18251_c0_g1_i1.p1 TRINITY_DN18251_c0_g1~~TRINITY_DN18251_c0_g1_i1.p1  ORF type:complete len:260 (+),score=20.19 TRINITY_DN18251_c0_g1_i1:85-864(+)